MQAHLPCQEVPTLNCRTIQVGLHLTTRPSPGQATPKPRHPAEAETKSNFIRFLDPTKIGLGSGRGGRFGGGRRDNR